ncbi:hypothetical protein MMC10_007204 [Thelotrema lepadinum]|nr:hypothetical protein [Thelotrema lepadinum]
MVAIKSLSAAALALAPSAVAYITQIQTPSSAAIDSTFTVDIQEGIYIQNWEDFGIVWGLSTPKNVYPNTAGSEIGFTDVKNSSEYVETGNLKYQAQVTIPDFWEAGASVLVAQIPYLVGASGEVGFYNFTNNIDITAASS